MKINEHTQWVWVGGHHIISNVEIFFGDRDYCRDFRVLGDRRIGRLNLLV